MQFLSSETDLWLMNYFKLLFKDFNFLIKDFITFLIKEINLLFYL